MVILMSMSVSKSKINSYKTCPLKFKYVEIDKLPQKTENEAFIIGGNLHKLLKLSLNQLQEMIKNIY